jgi:transposase
MGLICGDILRSQEDARRAEKKVASLAKSDDSILRMGAAVGLTTAAVLYVELGDPHDYDSASSYEKAAGLNLKERSSGKYKGQKKITKRGSGRVRKAIYWAALRLTQEDSIVHAWHQRKIRRDGGKKILSVIAIMRKLIRALWYVSRGATFDSSLLYDVNRLRIQGA